MRVITLARKPNEGSVAANAAKYGTGGINVDGTRIPTAVNEPDSGAMFYKNRGLNMPANRQNWFRGKDHIASSIPINGGRWPANLILEHKQGCCRTCEPGCPVTEMDRQSGIVPTGSWCRQTDTAHPFGNAAGVEYERWQEVEEPEGGASRYFLQVKPTGER